MAIDWVINKFDEIKKMAQAVINTSAGISSRNVIASAIFSLTSEPLITAHIHFLKGYHDAFFNIHFQWMKHIDKVTKKNGYLSRHMAVHTFVMHTHLNKIKNEWQTINHFLPFLNFCNEKISDPAVKVVTAVEIPKKFFALAHKMLLKHFNQWRSPQLLPLVLGGDEFPAQALSAYICNMPPSPNIIIPTSYYSNTHHTEFNISDLTQFLTQMISTTEEKDNLVKREYFQLHRPALEKLAMGVGGLWLVNQTDDDLKALLTYIKKNFLPLPSNNQCVEAGVKDAALCRRSGRSERIASLLNFFRSTITSDVVSDATATSIATPLKARGKKRKRDSDVDDKSQVWICESLKIESILKKANSFNPDHYSIEERSAMQAKISTEKHYSAGRREKSTIQFQAKMNVNKRMNLSQQKEGVDTTPLLRGTIQYGKLQKIHIDFVRKEILLRTQQVVDLSLGIRALTTILREDEKRITGHDLKYFKPKTRPAEEWNVG